MFAKIRKALIAAIMAAVGAYTSGQVVGELDTPAEWMVVAAAAVVAGVATWTVKNEPPVEG